MPWGDPGVTELLQLTETEIGVPAATGGNVTRTLQRAGLLRRLRFRMTSQLDVTAGTGYAAPTRSVYGPLSVIQKIRVEANGQIPLVDLSGLGATMYNEIQNPHSSVLARPLNISELQIADSLKLAQFDDATATASYYAKFPFEFQFAIPVNIRGQISELGLWLLQNQAIDVGINVTFNPIYSSGASLNSPWSNATPGTGGSVAGNAAGSKLEIERELYNLPTDPKNFPNLQWAHQIIEYEFPFTGSFARVSIPRSGLLLRAILVNLDSSGNLVEYSDLSKLSWIYGANESPINRSGQWWTQEYLQDYDVQPPKGVIALDFYKNGWDGLKLVKDTEVLANLRLESTFASTTTGTQKVILDRLYPVLASR